MDGLMSFRAVSIAIFFLFCIVLMSANSICADFKKPAGVLASTNDGPHKAYEYAEGEE